MLKMSQNSNGGGLSVSVTGKYTSVRHELAKESGKLTAGGAAKKLSEKLTEKVSAKEIVSAWTLLTGREPEWHHAGFYSGTMGRTFFFSSEQISELAERWPEVAIKIKERQSEIKRKAENIVTGFFFTWEKDYSGSYGKKRNYKVLRIYEGYEATLPNNFTQCAGKILESAREKVGKKYFGWDEPKLSEFEKRL